MPTRIVRSWALAVLAVLAWGCDCCLDDGSPRCEDFRFRVKLDGEYIPGICKISGLRRTTEVVEHREGGDPGRTHKSPGLTEYHPITLERSVTGDLSFEEWADDLGLGAEIGGDFRKEVVIELRDGQGVIVKSWLVHRCWISEYAIMDGFDSSGQSVAIERVTIENEGWESTS